ncbi:TPA: hypothetical protein N0F65_009966 [Lagenidium giganteum]|uniref:Uncharacterized protein n=1 Tax=Lagenidium giganteum TaxID=4803 RepID=A0AAV2YVP3_9STRA|nr:TPA: hypothetical protein N0F65_009966 [Lagenidium giganteum]
MLARRAQGVSMRRFGSPWLARTLSKSAVDELSASRGVRACVAAILKQKRELLEVVDDEMYTFHSTFVGASIGQHTRHSLDHLRKPLEVFHAGDNDIRYDIRERHTVIETDRQAALQQIAQIEANLARVGASGASSFSAMHHANIIVIVGTDSDVENPVSAAFMLSADGQEFRFPSTFSREIAFSVHHCIHHNALIKLLLLQHFPDVPLPPNFGMAPSTANYNLTH